MLTRDELRRYSRPLLVPEWAESGAQERLKAARVLVVGAGGLGCPVISALAGAGVGTLAIADGDTVSLGNLHRQTLYTTADVGRLKAEAAAARAQLVNPNVRVQALPALTAENALPLVQTADLTIDCTDNFETRYLINDACVAAGQRWVWGAAGGLEGMVSVFGPTCTLRGLFPDPAGAESCDTIGVLGPLLGVIGSLMAAEALKLLAGPDFVRAATTLEGTLLTYDLLNARIRRIELRPARQTAALSKSIL
ncbi:HesA/MoeB/ThiF family protein [Deinococcus sp. KNUC1210]|uniref:HesA/MoeB/ThiF family protein n=1 Tax=Deinococcus sp. KNUC1210 TaxID=2917691 RepID=UPI001EF15DF3|nr:HesA/MoeB/ThiF family protein [Deinococcus sp. KNUC1210]ULH16569.1 HesA/MoeB/ThiF family protein [Deinococcus sp. KNUC1210]